MFSFRCREYSVVQAAADCDHERSRAHSLAPMAGTNDPNTTNCSVCERWDGGCIPRPLLVVWSEESADRSIQTTSSLTSFSIWRHCSAKNTFCIGRTNGIATCWARTTAFGGRRGHETFSPWPWPWIYVYAVAAVIYYLSVGLSTLLRLFEHHMIIIGSPQMIHVVVHLNFIASRQSSRSRFRHPKDATLFNLGVQTILPLCVNIKYIAWWSIWYKVFGMKYIA